MIAVEDIPRLPHRPVDAHKGTFGHVLVVAGSRGMAGAAVLCASAVLRTGAGTVKIAVPESIQPTVAAGQICATTAGLPATRDGRFAESALAPLIRLAKEADVLAVGPGLGQGPSIRQIVFGLLKNADCPIILDADGLNALVGAAPWNFPSQVVLTPHPGEFSRLTGVGIDQVQLHRQEIAIQFAQNYRVNLVLKGHATVVTDGQRVYVNRTGNSGLATGGSGDVLTGCIAGLVAQGLSPFDASCLAAYLHGLAGDLARDELGEMSLIATDLISYLPKSIRTLSIKG